MKKKKKKKKKKKITHKNANNFYMFSAKYFIFGAH